MKILICKGVGYDTERHVNVQIVIDISGIFIPSNVPGDFPIIISLNKHWFINAWSNFLSYTVADFSKILHFEIPLLLTYDPVLS